MNFQKTFRYFYYRCVRLHGRPRELAMGMAIGLAVGLSPTTPIQMAMAIAIAALFGQSKFSAALGVWITNPITWFPIYLSTYTIGAMVMGRPALPHDKFLQTISHINFADGIVKFNLSGAAANLKALTNSVFLPMFVGGAILAIPVSIAGYWMTYEAIIAYRLKVKHRKANKMHKWKWKPHGGWRRESINPADDKQAGADCG